ncbi:hypothetical protein PF005_g16426 [Phytophthora fragariae]|uniref:Uncharacterized protein n=1 Tax=Phytophthora fragariae TaxID=53985 RepID=A0A6A3J829_9STRA|nr:hypothetical protein PF003_g11901 [Phytophthora fragariae]KAE8932342.1 hypothetical protein PF009_g17625 [Phytophthora fragariae]KAE8990651.1 hypothetical protein PF011_g18265 [Phytophthora fragariae]KAE9097091.1 hypothetical protein PF007_g16746 [Phytophthora fragariae]KAE9102099.1 hypothetical protein PF010_g14231 [Phytophthora fragariae]
MTGRQSTNSKSTLAKSTRALEKKHVTLRAKFQEQNEYLEITLAVRQGVTTDLQAKRKQVPELEREVARLTLAMSKWCEFVELVAAHETERQLHALG